MRRSVVAALSGALALLASGSAMAMNEAVLLQLGNFDTGPDEVIADGHGGVIVTTYGQDRIFRLTPPADGSGAWTATVLYSVAIEGLVLAPDGSLFGTGFGGASRGGTVLQLVPPSQGQTNWTERTIYSFPSTNRYHGAGVTLAPNGELFVYTFGTVGSTYPFGTIGKLTPPVQGGSTWAYSTIYVFPNAAIGYPHVPLTLGPDGGLYGVIPGNNTLAKQPSIFRLVPPPAGSTQQWKQQTLYSFKDSPNVVIAEGPLTQFYGGSVYALMESESGSSFVFKLAAPYVSGQPGWSFGTVYTFPVGQYVSNLTLAVGTGGKLYGLKGVTNPGAHSSVERVWQLLPPQAGQTAWQEHDLFTFSDRLGAIDGSGVTGLVVEGQKVFGTAEFGGLDNEGLVFELTPPSP